MELKETHGTMAVCNGYIYLPDSSVLAVTLSAVEVPAELAALTVIMYVVPPLRLSMT